MYKRRARILFVSTQRALLELALDEARRTTHDWLECRSELCMGPLAGWHPEAGDVDLIIVLSRDGTEIEKRHNTPLRYWRLGGTREQIRRHIEQELLSMVGGMKMLARLDGRV